MKKSDLFREIRFFYEIKEVLFGERFSEITTEVTAEVLRFHIGVPLAAEAVIDQSEAGFF